MAEREEVLRAVKAFALGALLGALLGLVFGRRAPAS